MSTLISDSISTGKRPLPIGIDRFEDLRTGSYYCVDKTPFIYEIIEQGSKVDMVPRPSRSGKSLHLSMLRQFLSIDADPALFDGLLIRQDKDFCDMHQGKYPVLYFDLNGLCISNYNIICRKLDQMLSVTAQSLGELAASPALDATDLEDYNSILHLPDMPRETKAEQSTHLASLMFAPTILTRLLYKHYRKQVVVLIDSYNGPLNYAYRNGLYPEVDSLMHGLFHGLLKGNGYLDFAVLTGCPRASKEIFFAGLNNFSLWDSTFKFIGDYFGFTEDEVQTMLEYYGIPERMDSLRANCSSDTTYSKKPVYCPGDVLRFVRQCIEKTAGAIPAAARV